MECASVLGHRANPAFFEAGGVGGLDLNLYDKLGALFAKLGKYLLGDVRSSIQVFLSCFE